MGEVRKRVIPEYPAYSMSLDRQIWNNKTGLPVTERALGGKFVRLWKQGKLFTRKVEDLFAQTFPEVRWNELNMLRRHPIPTNTSLTRR